MGQAYLSSTILNGTADVMGGHMTQHNKSKIGPQEN